MTFPTSDHRPAVVYLITFIVSGCNFFWIPIAWLAVLLKALFLRLDVAILITFSTTGCRFFYPFSCAFTVALIRFHVCESVPSRKSYLMEENLSRNSLHEMSLPWQCRSPNPTPREQYIFHRKYLWRAMVCNTITYKCGATATQCNWTARRKW